MRKNNLLSILFAAALIFMSSCAKDPMEELPGTWSTSDGGTITFNADGTGSTIDSEFFLWDCGTITINGQSEYIGPVTEFEWQITDSGAKNDNLFMSFSDTTSYSIDCEGTMEFPVKMNGKNSATVGATVFGIGFEVELTR